MAKILIVDDGLETIILFEGIIKTSGHEPFSIIESKNAIKAIEIFEIMKAPNEIPSMLVLMTLLSSRLSQNIFWH